MPNKIARPAREWLSAELDARRERLLQILDEDPVALWRAWEWCYGRPSQALDVAVSNSGADVAERLAGTVRALLGPGGRVLVERGESGAISALVVKGADGETRGVVCDLEESEGKAYVGSDPRDSI